jgi:hypothetical protein
MKMNFFGDDNLCAIFIQRIFAEWITKADKLKI